MRRKDIRTPLAVHELWLLYKYSQYDWLPMVKRQAVAAVEKSLNTSHKVSISIQSVSVFLTHLIGKAFHT